MTYTPPEFLPWFIALLVVGVPLGLFLRHILRSAAPIESADAFLKRQERRDSEGSANYSSPNQDLESQPAQEEEIEMTIDDYVARAQKAVADGDLDEAIDYFAEAIDQTVSGGGADSLAMAELLIEQGRVFQMRDLREHGSEINCVEYRCALAIMEQRLGGGSEALLPVLKLLIAWYFQTGEQQNAEALIRRCQNIADSARHSGSSAESKEREPIVPAEKPSPFMVPFRSEDESAVELCQEADDEYARGDYEAAIYTLGLAVESVQNEVGYAAPELIALFHRLGRAEQSSVDLNDGSEEVDHSTYCDYQVALSMLVQKYGFDSPALCPVLLDLASMEDQRGEHYRAETYLRRLSDIERNQR